MPIYVYTKGQGSGNAKNIFLRTSAEAVLGQVLVEIYQRKSYKIPNFFSKLLFFNIYQMQSVIECSDVNFFHCP